MSDKRKQQQKQSFDKILELLKLKNLKQFSLKSYTNRYYEKTSEEVDRQISCTFRPGNEEEKKQMEELQKQFQDLYEHDKEKYADLNNFRFTQSLDINNQLPEYQNLYDLNTDQLTELKHQQGEVLLIDIWATWCGPCQKPMQHNQEMLEKNEEKWKDKVRIVGVSVDDNRETVLKRVSDRNWNKVKHLKLKGWDGEHPLLKDFSVDGIPFVCLVGPNGKIAYTGHPSSINLEEKINSFLQDGQNDQQQKSELSSDQYKKWKKLYNEGLKSFFKDRNKDDYQFSFSLSQDKKVIVTPQGEFKNYEKPKLNAKVDTKYEDNYKQLMQFVNDQLGADFPLEKKELIFDSLKTVFNDYKQIYKILNENGLDNFKLSIQGQEKFTLEEYKLKQSKKKQIVVYEKVITPQDKEEEINKVNAKIQDYIRQQYSLGLPYEHLMSLYSEGIQFVKDEKEIKKRQNHQDEYKQAKELLSKNPFKDLEFHSGINYPIEFSISNNRYKVLDKNGDFEKKSYDKPIISYSIKKSDKQLLEDNILSKIFQVLNKDLFEIKEDLIETVDLEFGNDCKLCNKKLETPYYYNYWLKEHYCYECGNSKDETKQFIEQFKVPHNLIVINTNNPELLQNIEVYKLGQNIQPPAGTDYTKFNHQFGCNGICESDQYQGRYICLTCRPGPYRQSGYIDYCDKCVQSLIIEKNQKQIQNSQDRDDHNIEHLLLKILTPFGDSYKKY